MIKQEVFYKTIFLCGLCVYFSLRFSAVKKIASFNFYCRTLLLIEKSMAIKIVEFKAKIKDPEAAEKKLQELGPFFKGEDHQVDTYFNVGTGRLKLREGTIESALIWYQRPNDASSKLSSVLLYKHQPDQALKEVLTKANGIKVVVDKKRKIYFVGNVKFHFDEVEGLGKFIEVEAIDETGELGIEKIQQQCDHYAAFFNIEANEFMSSSYSDMLLKN